MTSPCTSDNVTEGTEEGSVDTKFYTYENTDPHARSRAFQESVMESCRSARQAQRARTHTRIARIPGMAMPLVAGVVGLTATLVAALAWGTPSAFTLQMGAVMAAMYTVTNDVRISIAEKNPDWRRRHRIVALVFRRNPFDRD